MRAKMTDERRGRAARGILRCAVLFSLVLALAPAAHAVSTATPTADITVGVWTNTPLHSKLAASNEVTSEVGVRQTSTGSAENKDNATFSINNFSVSGPNTLILLMGNSSADKYLTSATRDSQGFTEIPGSPQQNGGPAAAMFYRVGPNAGSANLSGTWNDKAENRMTAYCYAGVDQNDPFGDDTGGTGNTDGGVTVSSCTAGNLLHDIIMYEGNNSINRTGRLWVDDPMGVGKYAASSREYVTSDGNKQMSWNGEDGKKYAQVAVEIRAAAVSNEVLFASTLAPGDKTGHKVRYTMWYSGTGGAEVDPLLYDGSTLISTGATASLTTSATTYEWTLSAGEASNITESAGSYTNLRLRVVCRTTSQVPTVHYSWAQFECPSAGAVAPTVTAPTNTTQATDGSGNITIGADVSDADGDDSKLRVEYSVDGKATWTNAFISTFAVDYGQIPNTNNGAAAYQMGDTTGIKTTNGANTVNFVWDTQNAGNGESTIRTGDIASVWIRVKASDGVHGESSWAESASSFSIDNLAPAVSSGIELVDTTPTSGDASFQLDVAFTENNPDVNMFGYKLNGAAAYTEEAGQANVADPSAKTFSVTLNGTNTFTGVRCIHTDDFGKTATSEDTTLIYVCPTSPVAPTVDNPSSNRLDVSINTNLTAGLLYAIQCTNDTTYVQGDGTLGGSIHWDDMGGWGATVVVQGLDSTTTYGFRVAAGNPNDATPTTGENSASAFGAAADGTTTVGPPAPPELVNLTAVNITRTSADMRGQITSTGNVPTDAEMYWGDNNGMGVHSNWDATNDFGQIETGVLTNSVTGLLAGGVYYYRLFATNSEAGVWATPSMVFTTLQAGVSINDSAVVEGNSGTTNMVFDVWLNDTSAVDVTAYWIASNNTATVADNDYVATNGVLTISSGSTNGQLTVVVNGDTGDAVTETFYVTITNVTGGTLVDSQATGTIDDDDMVPYYLDGTTGGVINLTGFSVFITNDLTIDNTHGYITLYADRITVQNGADITAYGKGFRGGGGGGGGKEASNPGSGGGVGNANAGGQRGSNGSGTGGGNGGAGGGQADQESYPATAGSNSGGENGGNGGNGGGPFGGDGGDGGNNGERGYDGGYNWNNNNAANFDGTNTEDWIGFFYSGAPTNYGSYSIYRGSGSGGGRGGRGDEQVTGTGSGGSGGARGGNHAGDDKAGGGGGGGAAGGGAIVLHAGGALDLTGAGVLNAAGGGAENSFEGVMGGVGAGGGIVLIGQTVDLGSCVVSNHGGNAKVSNGGSIKLWTQYTNGLSTNSASLHYGKLFVGVYSGRVFVQDVTVVEGRTGFTNAVFRIWLDKALGSAVTVDWGTADGTATAGSDYLATNGQVTIPAGETEVTVTVEVANAQDLADTNLETFYVVLSNPVNATISDGGAGHQGIGTILKNVAIDDTVNRAEDASANPQTVFISDLVGYVFYIDDDERVAYRMTTDGGKTWGGAVKLGENRSEDQDDAGVSIWYDKWTPGNSGTKIHVAFIGQRLDQMYYNYLDTADNSTTGWVSVVDFGNYSADADSEPSIIRATDGALVVYIGDNGAGTGATVYRNADGTGASWSAINPGGTDDQDYAQLIPLAGGDVLCILHDNSNTSLESLIWTGSWSGRTVIDANWQNTSWEMSWSASMYVESGETNIYVVGHAGPNNGAYDIRAYHFKESTRAWTTLPEVVDDASRFSWDACAFVDSNNGDLYAIYNKGLASGNINDLAIYYKRYNGTSWDAEVGPFLPGTNERDDYRHVGGNFSHTSRMYAIWYDDDDEDLFGGTLRDLTSNFGGPNIDNSIGATGATGTNALLRAALSSTGGSATTVIFYWGDEDSTNDWASWDYTNILSAPNAVGYHTTDTLTNGVALTPASTYYYRCFATNATTWNDSETMIFRTLGPPNVTNNGATVDIGTATMQGTLTAGGDADAYFCWGDNDGGAASTGNWDNVISWGRADQEVLFSSTVTNLYFGLQYHYRVYVTNAYGTNWSEDATFLTLMPETDFQVPVTNHMEVWYDANYGVSTGAADLVTNWLDRSSHSRDLVADAGTPTLATNEIGEMPVVRFNASGEGLQMVDTGDVYFANEVYLVFRAGNGNEFFGPDWGSPFGVPNGADINRMYMMDGGQKNFWSSELPSGVTRNGDVIGSGNNFDLAPADLSEYMILKIVAGPNNETHKREYIVGTRMDGWANARFDIAEIIAYSETNTLADENLITSYLEYKYGITTPHTGYIPPVNIGITNTAATNVLDTTADLVGFFEGARSVFQVKVYWSTNNNADAAAWLSDGDASSQTVGWYTNVTGQTITGSVASLSVNSTYYYTMMATNAATNIWAPTNAIFYTYGPPVVTNDGATGLEVGGATLQGTVTAGIIADAWFCWGDNDAGTASTGNWDNVVAIGSVNQDVLFTSSVTNLYFGLPYHYRVYATNVYGAGWSSADTWLTVMPNTNLAVGVTNNLEAWYDAGYGVGTNASGNATNWLDRSGNGNHTTSVSGTPDLVDDEINGQPAVKFRAEHMVVNHAIVPREEWFVFRSGRYDTDPGNPHLWENGWGGPFGQQNDNGWMLEDNQSRTWNSRIATAMKQNGTNCTFTGNQYYFDQVGDYFILKVHPLNYGSANAYIARPNNSWYNGHLDIAEIIIYSQTNTVADENEIGDYLAYKYGITTTYSGYTPPVDLGVSNAPAENVGGTTADLVGIVESTQSVFRATVYWSTNDNADSTAWLADGDASSQVMSWHTNVVSRSITQSVGSLSLNTTYYYTMMVTNAATNIWAPTNVSFRTIGPPAVTNNGAADVGSAIATLQGTLTNGTMANAWFCWGDNDGGTASTGNWDNVVSMGSVNQDALFTNALTDLYYGLPYHYRVYVTNAYGADWSSVTDFLTDRPLTTVIGDLNWDFETGDLTDWTNVGAPLGADDIFRSANNPVNHTRIAGKQGTWWADTYRRQDASQSDAYTGIIETDTFVLGPNAVITMVSGGGSFAWSGTPASPGTTAGIGLETEVTPGTWTNAIWQTGGNNSLTARYLDASAYDGDTCRIRIYDNHQGGWGWTCVDNITVSNAYVTGYATLSISNTVATNVAGTTADLVGLLEGTGSVFEVTAYWSTNNNADSAAWLADGTASNQAVGWYTNVPDGTVTGSVGSLSLNTTYYYTMMATNACTNIWATTNATFYTAGAPAVTNDGATGIGVGAATLQGTLTVGRLADAWFCWGNNDGGTASTGNWDNVLSVGSVNQDVLFTNALTGLYYGVDYQYRVYASNAYGTGWSSLTNFLTDGSGLVLDATNTYATNITQTGAALLGQLDATQTVGEVVLYWSLNNNADGTAWLADGTAQNTSLGLYTNVAAQLLSNSVSSLTPGSTYYYTYLLANSSTNLWASPNGYFVMRRTDIEILTVADGDTTPSVAELTDFGYVAVSGGAATNTLTITNAGDIALYITSAPTLSGHSGDFTFDTGSMSTNIAPGGTTTFDVIFDPTTSGTRTGVVSIANNDPDEDPYDFHVRGVGLEPNGGIPFTETYEDSPAEMANTVGDINGQHGWMASLDDAALVQTSVKYEGSKAMSVAGGSVSNIFDAGSETNVTWEFWSQPPHSDKIPNIPASASAVFYVNAASNVVAYSNATPLTLSGMVVTNDTWVKFTVRADYTLQTWALWVDDNMLMTNAGFYSSTYTNLGGIAYMNLSTGDTCYVDNISIIGQAGDSDGDGVLDDDEVIGGTDINDSNSYVRIMSGDLTNANDVVLNMYLGGSRGFVILASDTPGGTKTALKTITNSGAMGVYAIVDTNAVLQTQHRFYSVKVDADPSWTNTTEWAMYRQPRNTEQRYLISPPVKYSSTNENNLNSTLGQQLSHGLYALDDGNTVDTITNTADRIRIRSGGSYSEYYLVSNSVGEVYWYEVGVGTADVDIANGTGMWVERGSVSADRTNTVFVGMTRAQAEINTITFTADDWTIFSWGLPIPKQHNTGSPPPVNQLGLANLGVGGMTSDENRPLELGDQIWVWEDNTWKERYWLIDSHNAAHDATWNNRWWDSKRGKFADFQLEAGKAYYYRHVTNQWGGVDFIWSPSY